MSRYIDADKAKEKLGIVRGAYSCFLEEDRPYYDVLSETIKMINEMPTADVVEAVRCKDCKYGKIDSLFCCEYECSVFGNSNVEADDFCSYGERKE